MMFPYDLIPVGLICLVGLALFVFGMAFMRSLLDDERANVQQAQRNFDEAIRRSRRGE